MKLVATKLDIDTVGKMTKLVIENIDAIASDLTVLDSRLLLGNASVDVVALDGTGALVLVAIDRTSDEQLLLKAVEAYSWCLEYPEAVRRLYPAADVSVSRPPRVMFVVERMSDSFHRKVKQLGFPEVDCVEFRHLAIDGAEAVHFDTVVRLRRATLVSEDTRPAAPPSTSVAPHDNAAPSARATSMKLQKLLNAEAPVPSTSRHAEHPVERPLAERTGAPTITPASSPAREPGVVVSMVHRAGRHATARHEEPAVTRRPVRDTDAAEPIAMVALDSAAAAALAPEPVVPTALQEPDYTVAPVLELVGDPHPAAAAGVERAVEPQPLAPPKPVLEAAPALDVIAESQPVATVEPAITVAAVVEPGPIVAVEPAIAVAPALETVVEPQPIAAVEATIARAPAVRPVVEPQMIVAPEPVVAAAPVIELIAEPTPVTAPEVAVAPRAVPESIAPIDTLEPPRISFADLSKELLAAQSVERKQVSPSKPVAPTRPVEPVVSIKPAAVAGTAQRVSLVDLSKELLGAATPVRTPQLNGPTPMRLQIPPVVEAPKSGEITRSVLQEIENAESEPEGAAAQPQTPAATAQTSPAAVLPQEFEGLKFPGDGVLTRQWMDFLNQMTAAK
jgi:hypothetical protein